MPGVVWFEHPFRVSFLRVELSETKTQPCLSKTILSDYYLASACYFKKKIVAQPVCRLFFFSPLSRSGQAGLRVVTVTQDVEKVHDTITEVLDCLDKDKSCVDWAMSQLAEANAHYKPYVEFLTKFSEQDATQN